MAALHRRRLRFIDGILADLEAHREVDPRRVVEARADIGRALKSGAAVRKLHRARVAQKAETFRDERADIRAAVCTRACGLCEACGQPLKDGDGELDEFFGGNGRRRQLMSIETCWLLHRICHAEKTANRPSAARWVKLFAAHARAHGYSGAAALAESRLPVGAVEASP